MIKPDQSQILYSSIVAILVIFQIASVVFLWTINTVGLAAEQLFALFLGADILSFAMVSYLYRSLKGGEAPRVEWLMAGAIMLVALIFAGAFV